jgi:hypothetical protein
MIERAIARISIQNIAPEAPITKSRLEAISGTFKLNPNMNMKYVVLVECAIHPYDQEDSDYKPFSLIVKSKMAVFVEKGIKESSMDAIQRKIRLRVLV